MRAVSFGVGHQPQESKYPSTEYIPKTTTTVPRNHIYPVSFSCFGPLGQAFIGRQGWDQGRKFQEEAKHSQLSKKPLSLGVRGFLKRDIGPYKEYLGLYWQYFGLLVHIV